MADVPGKDIPWWLCPNEPRCPHARVFHDVEDYDDPLPRCCAEGCDCGKRPAPVTHLCPPEGGVAPCCGKTPFELPGTDRITEDPPRVSHAACLACSDLDEGPCLCRTECGHLNCTGRWRGEPNPVEPPASPPYA